MRVGSVGHGVTASWAGRLGGAGQQTAGGADFVEPAHRVARCVVDVACLFGDGVCPLQRWICWFRVGHARLPGLVWVHGSVISRVPSATSAATLRISRAM